jgi:hypothetical protein
MGMRPDQHGMKTLSRMRAGRFFSGSIGSPNVVLLGAKRVRNRQSPWA